MNAGEVLSLSAERDAQLELRLAAYREGYRDGARDQFEAGYAAAIEDVKSVHHEVVDAVQLAGRRLAPGGEAWAAAVEGHGGTEYGGAGKPRVPVDPATIEQARGVRGRAA